MKSRVYDPENLEVGLRVPDLGVCQNLDKTAMTEQERWDYIDDELISLNYYKNYVGKTTYFRITRADGLHID